MNAPMATAPNAAIPVTKAWREKAKRALTGDMKPEDWRHLISGLLEFFEEEAEEPEHSEDGMLIISPSKETEKMNMAADESVKMPDVDGRLHVMGVNICMESVSPYKGAEIPGWEGLGLKADEIYQVYRPAEELRKPETLASANGIPLMRRHVATSAEDHKYYDTIGSTGTTARWEAPFVVNDLVVWPATDIEGITDRTKRELSPGYRYKPVLENGTFEGKKYQVRMTGILFNHIASVVTGRQGPSVAIDTAVELQWAAIERAILSV